MGKCPRDLRMGAEGCQDLVSFGQAALLETEASRGLLHTRTFE